MRGVNGKCLLEKRLECLSKRSPLGAFETPNRNRLAFGRALLGPLPAEAPELVLLASQEGWSTLDGGKPEFFSAPFVRTSLELDALWCGLSEEVTGDFVKDEYPFTSTINVSSSFRGSSAS